MSEFSTSETDHEKPFAWLRALFAPRRVPVELSQRTRKLPPIADLLNRREPLPPD